MSGLTAVQSPLPPAALVARLFGTIGLSVANIDDPSTELNAIAGGTKGELRVCYQTAAGADSWTLYAWDDADSGAEAVPYRVDGSSGMWVAIAGKYVAASLLIQTNLTVGGNATVTGTLAVTGTASVATPTADGHATTKAYVDGLVEGLNGKGEVRVVATSNIDLGTASDPGAQDGVTLSDGDLILLTAQSTGSQNGSYTAVTAADPTTWTRTDNLATGAAARNAIWLVSEGSTYADTRWWCTDNEGSDVVGTDVLTITQFSGAAEITAGDGLDKTGNTLSVASDVERTTAKDTNGGYVGRDGSGHATITGTMTANKFASAVHDELVEDGYTQADDTAATTFASFAHATYQGAFFEYVLRRGTAHARIGTLVVIHNAGAAVSVDDTGKDEVGGGSSGITWSAVVNGANIDVKLAVDNTDTDDVFLVYRARLMKVYSA